MIYRSTFSERKTWKQCKRKWYFQHYRKLARIREDVATAATLGTRVHEPLGIYYDPNDKRDPIHVFAARAEADLANPDLATAPDKLKKLGDEIELARIMVEGYFEWLAETGADEDLEVLGAEVELEVKLAEIRGRVVTLLSKQDARFRRLSDGAVLFMDHKTVQSFEKRVNLLHLDEQMKSYMLAEHLVHSGEDRGRHPQAVEGFTRVEGAIYNMLRKVKRSVRAKPPFYARECQSHNVNVLRSYWRQVVGEVEAILAAHDALDAGADPVTVVPPSPHRDCSWSCPFLPVCPMVDDSSTVAERVIHSSYFETDPLARYAAKETE